MNKLKNIVLIIAGTLLLSNTACCRYRKVCGRGKEERVTEAPAADPSREGYTAATVISYKVDACTWLLKLDDDKKLEPQPALPEAFQKDELKVWVKYETPKGAMSTCMAGTIIKITDIKERK